MIRLFWAFGSVLLVMVIMYFLPLGLTIKGKIIIALAGFLITLGGLAAATFFSMWQTLFMLVVLIPFAAYIMDRQLGSSLYCASTSYAEDYDTDDVQPSHIGKTTNYLQTRPATTEIPLVSAKLSKEKEISNPQPEIKQTEVTELSDIPSVDEDISFLLDRSLGIEEKESTRSEDNGNKQDYLSEIEKWLEDQSDEGEERNEAKIPESFENVLPIIPFDDQPSEKSKKPAAQAGEQTANMEEIPVLSFSDKGGKES